MRDKQITVGDFCDPRQDDANFPTIEQAFDKARGMSREDDNRAVAVWWGADLQRLFFRGYELEPV